jgi:hypothetical protein
MVPLAIGGTSGNWEPGISYLKNLNPDHVFLDVEKYWQSR